MAGALAVVKWEELFGRSRRILELYAIAGIVGAR